MGIDSPSIGRPINASISEAYTCRANVTRMSMNALIPPPWDPHQRSLDPCPYPHSPMPRCSGILLGETKVFRALDPKVLTLFPPLLPPSPPPASLRDAQGGPLPAPRLREHSDHQRPAQHPRHRRGRQADRAALPIPSATAGHIAQGAPRGRTAVIVPQ